LDIKTLLNEKEFMKKLLASAKAAQKNAYAPYSGFKIGAAILTNSGHVFAGCNVENSSYGGTICAERVAIFNAVQAEGKIKIKEVMVVNDSNKAWPPCGLCRQVIAEFATPKTKIYLANKSGVQKTFYFSELFPEGFSAEFLK
jgi:cytidine deaminase